VRRESGAETGGPTAVVCLNGHHTDSVFPLIAAASLVVAADGGARLALEAGRVPDLVIGDLDSLTADETQGLAARGAEIVQVPAAKDETDGELALDAALSRDACEIVLCGALGGPRAEHELGNLGLLIRAARHGVRAWIDDGDQRAFLVTASDFGDGDVGGRGPGLFCLELEGLAGFRLSLLPFACESATASVEGVRWPLSRHVLEASSTLGVSNVITDDNARVTVHDGTLVALVTLPVD
jgi:thiamine pyrophosphokinase